MAVHASFPLGNRYAALGNHQPGRAFKRELTMAVNETDGDATKLRRIAEVLIDRAIAGDIAAIREIIDRVDGRVPMALPEPADDASTQITEIRRIIINPAREIEELDALWRAENSSL